MEPGFNLDNLRYQYINQVKDKLANNGYFYENVAALIASQVAVVRNLFENPIDAFQALTDALAGKHNTVPQEVVDRLKFFVKFLEVMEK